MNAVFKVRCDCEIELVEMFLNCGEGNESKLTTVGGAGAGKTQINWKTGVFFDEDGVKKQLTPDELEDLR